jgi:hypothetical protein
LLVILLLVLVFMLVGVIIHLVNKLYATSIHLKDLVPLDLLIALRDGGIAVAKVVTDATPSDRDDWVPGALEKITAPLVSASAEAAG